MIDFKNKPIFAMIHLAGSVADSLEEIKILEEEGVDGIIVENYHGDVSDMIDVLKEIKDSKLIVGLNVLPNEYKQAFEMANEYGASFIQLDHVAGRYQNGASDYLIVNRDMYMEIKNKYPNITVLGGVWPKYYHPVKNSNLEFDIKEGMERAEAIVVTGAGTGKETPIDKIKEFRRILGEHPLIIGAGLTPSTVVEQLSIADGAIVGSTFKPHGITTQKIQRSLVREFMNEVIKIRK
jgi:predicted TIM-barrel enzyme